MYCDVCLIFFCKFSVSEPPFRFFLYISFCNTALLIKGVRCVMLKLETPMFLALDRERFSISFQVRVERCFFRIMSATNDSHAFSHFTPEEKEKRGEDVEVEQARYFLPSLGITIYWPAYQIQIHVRILYPRILQACSQALRDALVLGVIQLHRDPHFFSRNSRVPQPGPDFCLVLVLRTPWPCRCGSSPRAGPRLRRRGQMRSDFTSLSR
jgi:hypothetical protein